MKAALLTLALVLSCPSPVPAAASKVSQNDPIYFFQVEKSGIAPGQDGRVNLDPLTGRSVLQGLSKAGFNVQAEEDAPLVSEKKLKYSEAKTASDVPSYLGYVYLRAGDNEEMTVKSEKGKTVVLQSEVHEIRWKFDRKAAFAIARRAGSKYALVAEVTVENSRAQGALQPTVTVSLDATLVRVSDSRSVRSFSDSLTRQGATAGAAAKEAAQYLGKKLAAEILAE